MTTSVFSGARRRFLRASATLPALGATGWLASSHSAWAAAPDAAGWKAYDITTTVDIAERTNQARVWIPLPADQLGDYQRTLATRFEAPGAKSAQVVTVGDGVQMLAVEWNDPAAPQHLTLVNRVATRDRAVDLGASGARHEALSAKARNLYLQGSSLKPVTGIVRQTAAQITKGSDSDMAKAQAIYDWIVANCHREGSVRGCGTGDVSYLLTSGNLGGKCADLNGLFVALARASGVPARDAYGVRIDDSVHGFKSLGKSGDITRAQHCRAEFYAQGYGWIPVDPADVRKVVLEEEKGGIAVNDPRVRAADAMLFGAWEMNWLAYNHGEDVVLPGSSPATKVGFLMYPNGETADGRLDSLDPQTFSYRIASKPVTA